MESKTLAAIVLVLLCALFFPVAIGIVSGVFGAIGGIIGGIFGVIGGMLGAIFGVIGGIIGAVFGFFGWIFGEPFHWNWPGHFLSPNAFTVLLIVIIVVLISRKTRDGKQQKH